MIRRICIFIALLILISVPGCSLAKSSTTTPSASATTPPADIKQLRQAEIAGMWTVRQMEINLEGSVSIVLKLKDGDAVEGYFYLTKGNNIDFQISGNSLIYQSNPAAVKASTVASDRFAFTASGAQGIAYTLKFTPVKSETPAAKISETVFLELIYPRTGEIFNPMGTK